MSFRPALSAASGESESSSAATAGRLTALFRFVSSIGLLSVNSGHSPWQLTAVPRKLHVLVELRTVALHGLSYADFQLATQIDGLAIAGRRQANSKQQPPQPTAARSAVR